MAPSSPADPPRTSALAVASLVVGVLFCVPYLGLVAMLLAGTAIYLVRKSEGRLEGASFAVAALALGVFNLLLSGAGTAAFLLGDEDPTTATVVVPTPPPTSPPSAPPPAVAPGGEDGQMTMINEVTEVVVGALRLVDVPPTKRTLDVELDEQRKKAAASGERMVLFTSAEGCRPCLSIAAVLGDSRMQAALKGVRLVRVDTHALGLGLDELGIPSRKIPGFYLLGKDLSPVDGVTGGEWDDDTPENAAPVLGSFLQGTYRRRREPFKPEPRMRPAAPPRPTGTFL